MAEKVTIREIPNPNPNIVRMSLAYRHERVKLYVFTAGMRSVSTEAKEAL